LTNKEFTSWISDDKNQKYVGGVKEGKKHGQGTYTWIGIGEISGIFEEDKFPNYGTFIDYEDHKYVGEMKEQNCKYNGKGTFVHFKEKYKYEGEFKDSQRHGYGTFVQEDGSTFKGNWKNGLKHGKGTLVNAMFFPSGEEKGEEFAVDRGPLTGEYIEDHPHGIFNWEMGSGRKYVGEINQDGLFHGKGTLTHPDGKIEKGIWENAKLVEVSKESNFNIVPIIALLVLFQLVYKCHRNDWLNQSTPNSIEKKIKRDQLIERFEKLKKGQLESK
jgi:hypothetical protein